MAVKTAGNIAEGEKVVVEVPKEEEKAGSSLGTILFVLAVAAVGGAAYAKQKKMF